MASQAFRSGLVPEKLEINLRQASRDHLLPKFQIESRAMLDQSQRFRVEFLINRSLQRARNVVGLVELVQAERPAKPVLKLCDHVRILDHIDKAELLEARHRCLNEFLVVAL